MTRPPMITRVARMAKKRLIGLIKLPSDLKGLHELQRSPDPQAKAIAEALARLRRKLPLGEAECAMRIEDERRNLLNRLEPLVDGSLGQGGLYDIGKTVADVCSVSKSPRSALLLYLLVRTLKPRSIIELGTNVGISSAYLASALNANGPTGKLITLDASPYRQRLATQIHSSLGLRNVSYMNGLFKETLRNALEDAAPVDLAFIDGHHQHGPTLAYLEQILQFAAPGAVFVFDDIRWSDDMKRAWSDIQADKRFQAVIDLYSVGICVRTLTVDTSRVVLRPIYGAL